MAGYSGMPLLKKLGFKDSQVNFVSSGAPYFSEVQDWLSLESSTSFDFIHIFAKTQVELEDLM